MRNIVWQVEVDKVQSAEWSKLLDLFDDASIYQTAAYGEVRWGQRNISRIILKRDGEVMGIAQLRIIRPTPLKYGLAYLRWGPLWERRGVLQNTEVPGRLARAIEDEYVNRRGLFLRIIPNAFVNSSRANVFRTAFSNLSCEYHEANSRYRTFLMDLTPTKEELRQKLDKKWRNQLTHSEKNHLTVTIGNGLKEYRTFCDMYYQMRKRKAFETTVDVDEFRRIQETLIESQRLKVLICKDHEIPVAGLVASTIGDCAIYLLGATSDEGLKSKGSYLLQWTMISWLKEHGIKTYDLGGIDPEGNRGVFHFKKGLAGVETCQMNPFVASVNTFSSLIGKVSAIMQRTYVSSSKIMNQVHAIK